MADNDFDKFSVIRSRLKIFEECGIGYITKEINLIVFDKSMCKNIQRMILRYISSIKKAGIPVPEVKEYSIKEGKLFFVFEYKGINIIQMIGNKKPDEFFEKHAVIFSEIINIIKKAQEADLFLDPHIKNFVIDKEKIYYVDFFPPYSPKYNKLVIEKSGEDKQEIVKENLSYFNPKELGCHFAADLLKLSLDYMSIMAELHKLLKKEGIVSSSYEEFLKKADLIKKIEQERIKRNIFLI